MTDTTRTPEQLVVEDSSVTRDRIGRALFGLIFSISIILAPAFLLGKLSADFFDYHVPGTFLGGSLGMLAVGYMLDHMIVRVDLNRAFVTVDNLRAFFKRKDVYTLYGPGFHLSYPWEAREERYNVSLDEVGEDFEFTIITSTGPVTIYGSYRIRPRFTKEELVAFLGGVAQIAKELSDIIGAFAYGQIAPLTSDQAKNRIAQLNLKLKEKFEHGTKGAKDTEVSNFEERFGIVVGDVTVAEIRMTKEAETTRAGLDEALNVMQGVAVMLGYNNEVNASGDVTETALQKLQHARATPESGITQDIIDRTRREFLAISENVPMTIDAKEIAVRFDTHPDVVRALGDIAPAIAELARAYTQNRDQSKE